MKPLLVNIFFTTFSINNTKNLIYSVKDQLNTFPNNDYFLIINIIYNNNETEFEKLEELIGFSNFQINLISQSEITLLESKYQDFIYEANCNINVNSIQRGRIQQQIYIKEHYSKFQNTIVWQVDDDMLFKSFEIKSNKIIMNNDIDYFGKLLNVYSKRGNEIDALVAKSNYTPPIPSLLYTLNQLTDILKNEYKKTPIDQNEDYHDYYFSSLKIGYYNIKLHEEENTTTLIKRILNGQPITRPVLHKQLTEMSNEPFFIRGGNFIVFNTELFLTVPHLGFVLNKEEPARRSDMLHASLALDLGYKIIENHELILVHNRCFEEYSFEKNIHDYYNDLIGNIILIRLHKSIEEVNERIDFHKRHLDEIILLFEEYNLKSDYKKEFKLLQDLKQLVNQLKWVDIEPKYNEFLEKYKNIRKREDICKLLS